MNPIARTRPLALRRGALLATLAAVLAFAAPGQALDEAMVHQDNGTMTLNLPDTPLGVFLKIVSQTSEMQLIANAQLSAKPISVYLPRVTPREALDAVCAAYGLAYKSNPGGNVLVVTETDVAFFTLEHADAERAQTLATALAGDGARVAFDQTSNTLAVRSSPQGLKSVREMIESIDQRPGQVIIEATLAELTEDAQKDLGISWTPDGNLVTVRGAARQTELPFSDKYVPDGWTYGTVSFQNFLVRLQALERDGKANVLANPRIAAINNKEARIEIVTNTVIGTKRTFDSVASERVTEEPIYADVGITLTATPRIHKDGRITLDVVPSVSTSAQSPFFDDAVDTFNRQARTTLILDDGQTIAIGGLRRNDSQETVQKVPILGDVPVLGRLFRRTQTRNQNVELVVFLTPRLLTDERIAEDVSAQQRRMVEKEMIRDGSLMP